MAGSHGGARAGAGRKRLTLERLVLEERFDPTNVRHRWLLEHEDLPEGHRLVGVQRSYRWSMNRNDRAFIARRFADLVEGRAEPEPPVRKLRVGDNREREDPS